MTDKLPPLFTQIVPPSQPPFLAPASAPAPYTAKHEIGEEEPYTIKCICNYSDDDGNTIYCETCDTWQHIECYYPDHVQDALREDFAHSCVDCKPRALNRQLAIERQTLRTSVAIVEQGAVDKKAKRSPAKSHKKKPRPSELALHGQYSGSESTKHASLHDQHAKKAKTTHKANPFPSSQAPKRSPSQVGKANHEPHSPATALPDLPDDFQIHDYSAEFLLRHGDGAASVLNTKENFFVSLDVSNYMSQTLRDPHRAYDCFRRHRSTRQDVESQQRPPEIVSVKDEISENRVVRWQCLRAPSEIAANTPLLELNGQIGFQQEYCQNPLNRWAEFTTPLPFVFFHPDLPLYIDTRAEGSPARLVRRSCNPNAFIDTFIFMNNEGAGEYRECRLWLMSTRPIAALEQITIAWDFHFPPQESARLHRVLNLEGANMPPELVQSDDEYQNLSSWMNLVLSEYGGCACKLGNDCAFARFHRNHLGRLQTKPSPATAKKKSRKPKPHSAVSPISTGHATNSRAPSEGHLDDVAELDSGSASASSRSKTPSQDMAPAARQGSMDAPEPMTDREKRKLIMVEESFRRLEQQPIKKKKRVNDEAGTSHGKAKPTTRGTAPQLATHPSEGAQRLYIDAATSRSKPGSPSSLPSPRDGNSVQEFTLRSLGSAALRPKSAGSAPSYVDAATQTDGDRPAWDRDVTRANAAPKRRIVSLSQRLLNSRHLVREEQRRLMSSSAEIAPPPNAIDVDIKATDLVSRPKHPQSMTTDDSRDSLPTPGPSSAGDVQVPDVPVQMPTSLAASGVVSLSVDKANAALKYPSPALRVQMISVPAFGNAVSAVSSTTTPTSAESSMAHGPFSAPALANALAYPFAPPTVNGVAMQPSPVKKKMSVSDWTSRRKNKPAPSKPFLGDAAVQPAMPGATETKPMAPPEASSPPAAEKDSARNGVPIGTQL